MRTRGSGKLVVSTIDQAVLSALSLGLAFFFIRYAPKEEYGLYTLVNGLVLLMTGVQAALVTTPLTANGARLSSEERDDFVHVVLRLQAALTLLLSLLLGGVLAARGGDALLCAGAALSVAGTMMREFHRTVEFLDGRPARVLGNDLLFVGLCVLGVVGVHRLGAGARASHVLLIVGVAALVPGLGALRLRRRPLPDGTARRVARLLVDQGKWTLPGMGVTWGQNTGYAYAVALFAGRAAVAELAAARLFIMPISLLVTAWGRIFLPRVGAFAVAEPGRLFGAARQSARGLLAATALHLGLLLLFFRLGGTRFLPEKYAGLSSLVLAWSAFLVVNVLRSVATLSLIARTEFRKVFTLCVAGAATSLVLMAGLLPLVGPSGAVYGMSVGELCLGCLAWRALSPSLQLKLDEDRPLAATAPGAGAATSESAHG